MDRLIKKLELFDSKTLNNLENEIKSRVARFFIKELKEVELEYGEIYGNLTAMMVASEVISSNEEIVKKEFVLEKEKLGLSEGRIHDLIDDSIRTVIKLKIGLDFTSGRD